MADTPSSCSGFQSQGFIRDRLICYRYEAIEALKRLVLTALGRRVPSTKRSPFSNRRAKALVLEHGLAVTDGKASWFYSAFDRGDQDPLTNYALQYLETRVPKDSRILVTGCGPGIMVFHLAGCGFRDIVGIDLLPECIAIAKRLEQECGVTQATFYRDDCFQPKLEGSFDVITVLHWLYSAWMGNYGNSAIELERARDPRVREELLEKFLGVYVRHLNPGGLLVVEVTDAITDHRIPGDHPLREASTSIYPVRQSAEQVDRCAAAHGLQVVDRKLCVSYGHHPRMVHFLKKA